MKREFNLIFGCLVTGALAAFGYSALRPTPLWAIIFYMLGVAGFMYWSLKKKFG